MCLGCWDVFGIVINVAGTFLGSKKVSGMLSLFLFMCQVAGPYYGLWRDRMCVWDVGLGLVW